MTLKSYYYALPDRTAPKKDLLNEIVERCGVSMQTARNWVIYGIKPRDFRHVRILSELTGLKDVELW